MCLIGSLPGILRQIEQVLVVVDLEVFPITLPVRPLLLVFHPPEHRSLKDVLNILQSLSHHYTIQHMPFWRLRLVDVQHGGGPVHGHAVWYPCALSIDGKVGKSA